MTSRAEKYRIYIPNGIERPTEDNRRPFDNRSLETRTRDWIWTNHSESGLRDQILGCLFPINNSFNTEYRIADIPGYIDWLYVAVDIALVENGMRKVAIEVKQKDSRAEIMRGIGQCLVYKHAGFEHVILTVHARDGLLSMVETALRNSGILYCAPWEVEELVRGLLNESACG